MEHIFHSHDQYQSGQHGKPCPLQIHKGGVTDDSRIGMKQPKAYNIEEKVKAKCSQQKVKMLKGMQCSVVERIDEKVRAQHNQAIQNENDPKWKCPLGKIPIRKA
ncbi:hypothetical protein PRABACTJOHN_03242 [Parabacteroides johnsonii DSM 18315]|uniref:Uncharacterized protein n=1 Tax=Parabacteroides johnsonii DSM 18315 TaxID=537006 RepID=B7BDW6_9BACT|nr:hypothetical protein PRABACTJOHN_03242 [Parabacteroides johnsonii DSM 18315]